jgi:hypothetical protein
MATQRVIPPEVENAPAQTINITASGASPKACIIQGSQQQAVTFTNNSGSSITITFEENPICEQIFTDVENLSPTAPNNSATQTPLIADGTVNYNVTIGGTTSELYAIQVGVGPMYIEIATANAGIITNPSPVVVPVGGNLEMISTDFDYTVKWSPLDPFSPAIGEVYVGAGNNTPSQDNQSNIVQDYTYTLTKAPVGTTGSGGGTVKIKSS